MTVRIALASMVVAVVAIVVTSIGVFAFGSRAFERLMVEHGSDVADARSMFDESVTVFLAVASAAALAGSIGLAALLARWLAAPLRTVSAAAERLAGGDRTTRVEVQGPSEVEALARSFNELAQRLEEQERMRSEFIANAAHELRTPLTNLLGYLDALRDGVFPATSDSFMSLREEVDRLVRLSRSLDSLAAGDRATESTVEDLDLRESIEMAVEFALPAFERKGIRVSVQVPERVRVRANKDHMAQVFANLLQNSERYTPAGGEVTIAAERGARWTTVSVTNTGEGIPANDLPHVFERFYRVEKSRDRARGGAGIGLAIVKQLVELGGGSVGAESAHGLTRFWLQLPT